MNPRPVEITVTLYSFFAGYWVREKETHWYFQGVETADECEHEFVCFKRKASNKFICIKCGKKLTRAHGEIKEAGVTNPHGLKALQQQIEDVCCHIKLFPYPQTTPKDHADD